MAIRAEITGNGPAQIRVGDFSAVTGRQQLVERFNTYFGLPGRAFVQAILERDRVIAPKATRANRDPNWINEGNPQGDRLRESVKNTFFERIRRIYELPEETDVERLFMQALQVANETVADVAHTVAPHNRDVMERRDELASSNPTDLLELLAKEPIDSEEEAEARGISNPVHSTLEFEARRQLLLAGIALGFEALKRNYDLEHESNKIQKRLDRRLFEGPTGKIVPMKVYAYHDRQTNRVLGLLGVDDIDALQALETSDVGVWREHNQKLRPVRGDGFVLSHSRVKSGTSAVEKVIKNAVLEAAKTGNDAINPTDLIHDPLGGTYVVYGTGTSDQKEVLDFEKRFEEVLYEEYPGQIESIEEDNHINGDPTQAGNTRYRRLIVKFSHLPITAEYMFFGEKDYLNYRVEAGDFDEEKQTQTGAAHEIYRVKRVRDVAGVLWDENLPEYNDLHLDSLAQATMQEHAEHLRMNANIISSPLEAYRANQLVASGSRRRRN